MYCVCFEQKGTFFLLFCEFFSPVFSAYVGKRIRSSKVVRYSNCFHSIFFSLLFLSSSCLEFSGCFELDFDLWPFSVVVIVFFLLNLSCGCWCFELNPDLWLFGLSFLKMVQVGRIYGKKTLSDKEQKWWSRQKLLKKIVDISETSFFRYFPLPIPVFRFGVLPFGVLLVQTWDNLEAFVEFESFVQILRFIHLSKAITSPKPSFGVSNSIFAPSSSMHQPDSPIPSNLSKLTSRWFLLLLSKLLKEFSFHFVAPAVLIRTSFPKYIHRNSTFFFISVSSYVFFLILNRLG